MSLTFSSCIICCFYSLVQSSVLVHITNIVSHHFNTTPELTSTLRKTLMPTRHVQLKQPQARKIKAQLEMKAGNYPRRKYATVITKALLIMMDTTTKSGSGQMKKRLRSKQKNPPSTVK